MLNHRAVRCDGFALAAKKAGVAWQMTPGVRLYLKLVITPAAVSDDLHLVLYEARGNLRIEIYERFKD